MSGDKPEECFTDVGLYVSAVRRVEPEAKDISSL